MPFLCNTCRHKGHSSTFFCLYCYVPKNCAINDYKMTQYKHRTLKSMQESLIKKISQRRTQKRQSIVHLFKVDGTMLHATLCKLNARKLISKTLNRVNKKFLVFCLL